MAFQDINNCPDGCIESFRKRGNGRVGNGRCGALYAARLHIQAEHIRRQIEDESIRVVGDASCHTIRKAKLAGCESCVRVAPKTPATIIGSSNNPPRESWPHTLAAEPLCEIA